MKDLLTSIRKRFSGRRRDDVQVVETILAELEGEIATVEAVLTRSRETYGAALISGEAKEGDVIEQAMQEAEGMLHRLRVARDAVQMRLEEAKAATAKATLGERWALTSAALTRRQEAFVALEESAKAFGAAYRRAEEAATAAYEALPVRQRPAPGCAPVYLQPEYTDLRGEVGLLLSLATDGRWGGQTGSVLHELREQPTLTARSAAAAAEWLALQDPKEVA